MANQFIPCAAALAALVVVPTEFAVAAQSSFDDCRYAAGCAHFEGYVYVRPDTANAPVFGVEGKAAAESGRLYIHVEGDEAR